ncbi:MAG: hypothetical protein M1825_003250 [Sarcosagium campestre]|nr:MAG: hypothetical protein M1825_003250 [Sarcosagium campestre]
MRLPLFSLIALLIPDTLAGVSVRLTVGNQDRSTLGGSCSSLAPLTCCAWTFDGSKNHGMGPKAEDGYASIVQVSGLTPGQVVTAWKRNAKGTDACGGRNWGLGVGTGPGGLWKLRSPTQGIMYTSCLSTQDNTPLNAINNTFGADPVRVSEVADAFAISPISGNCTHEWIAAAASTQELQRLAEVTQTKVKRKREDQQQPIVRSVLPDILHVDGVDYSDGQRGDRRYHDAQGNLLDLDALGL